MKGLAGQEQICSFRVHVGYVRKGFDAGRRVLSRGLSQSTIRGQGRKG